MNCWFICPLWCRHKVPGKVYGAYILPPTHRMGSSRTFPIRSSQPFPRPRTFCISAGVGTRNSYRDLWFSFCNKSWWSRLVDPPQSMPGCVVSPRLALWCMRLTATSYHPRFYIVLVSIIFPRAPTVSFLFWERTALSLCAVCFVRQTSLPGPRKG